MSHWQSINVKLFCKNPIVFVFLSHNPQYPSRVTTSLSDHLDTTSFSNHPDTINLNIQLEALPYYKAKKSYKNSIISYRHLTIVGLVPILFSFFVLFYYNEKRVKKFTVWFKLQTYKLEKESREGIENGRWRQRTKVHIIIIIIYIILDCSFIGKRKESETIT